MKKKVSTIAALFLLITLMTSQLTVSAFNFTPPYQLSAPLWTMTRWDAYPNTHNPLTPVRIYSAWYGTQTNGNGSDWLMFLKNPGNQQPYSEAKLHYSYIALAYVYRSNPSATVRIYVNNVDVTATTTTSSPSEVYDINGNRVTTGVVYFSGQIRIIPISQYAAGSMLYIRVEITSTNGTSSWGFYLTI